MLKSAFIIAYRGIIRNWRQSFTALISIATSFISLTLFQGYMDDVQKMYLDTNIEREMMGHVIIENKNPKIHLNQREQEKILSYLDSTNEVAARVRFLPISGTITNGSSSMVFVGFGTDVAEGQKMRAPSWEWNALAGSPLPLQGDGLLIGHKLARILGCTPDPMPDFKQGLGGFSAHERPLNCPLNNFQLNVVTVHAQANSLNVNLTGITDAIYKELDERFVSLPLTTAQALMDTQNVGHISVKLKNPEKKEKFLSNLNSFLKTNIPDAEANGWENHRLGDLYNRTMSLLGLFRNFVVSVILVISSLGVFNTLLRNISERSREIGTLRSIGFRPFQIRLFFGFEALILSGVGCLIGLILSSILEAFMNFLSLTYKPGVFSSPVPFRIYVAPYLMTQTALFLITLVLITALVSLNKPLKQRISDCLTHV